ncbi:restriction endonuclease subunit S [Sunxiuqinia rutila]|uniref:restriction endonuclease subunit S n=1 Tax=Sunxiuqinia rutila TaxID=1397841 RepID=UPI003D368E33
MGKDLPNTWVEIQTGDVSVIIRGVTYKKTDASTIHFENSVLILRGGNIQDGKINLKSDSVYVNNSIVKDIQKIKKGDVIIVGSTGSKKLIGKAAICDKDESEISFGAFLTLLRPSKLIAPRYFDYYFLTDFYRNEIRNLAGGININNIKREHLEQLLFPLPPLPEQNRIVEKLDVLFGHLEQIKSRLDNVPALLKNFRQAVLNQAVTGKLTEEWRVGRKLEEWNDIILKDFTEIDVGPAFKSAEFEDAGIRLLRGENIEPGSLRWNNTVYFPKEKLQKYNHLFIEKGDVILAMDRPIISTGLKLAKAKKEDLPCVLVQRVARFRPSEKLSSGYLYFLISSDSYIKHLFGEQTGTQIPHISSKQILSFNCRLPNIEEQQEIVDRIESLFAKADKIEQQYQNLKEKIDNLPQSILAKAFKGELVEQLPTDGDARELLAEIEKAKAELSKTAKPKRGKTRKIKGDEDGRMVAEPKGRYGKK